MRWALGGRSEGKLRALAGTLETRPEIVVADATDRVPLAKLAQSTRVVLTAAGPYTLYEMDLVAACAAAGTHYADLSGQPAFQRAAIDAFDELARETGARIDVAAGYDSRNVEDRRPSAGFDSTLSSRTLSTALGALWPAPAAAASPAVALARGSPPRRMSKL